MNMYSLIHENLKGVFQLKLCQTARKRSVLERKYSACLMHEFVTVINTTQIVFTRNMVSLVWCGLG